ncbi:MAG: hypothetical protein M3445_10125 [Actinomycetota bacterium]|nr:hypothetical protein [Actinomycetota bacterium]
MTFGLNVPLATSDNIELVNTVFKPGAIAGVFSPSAPYFYVSTLESIDVYDVEDPLNPVLAGTLPQAVFENEAMNYGERTNKRGKTTRFVLVGVDLTQASSDDPQHNNLDGASEVIVVDVTDPTEPFIRSRTPATTSTHTVACVNVRSCTTAYTAGSRPGRYSIINLSDLDNPREVDARPGVKGKQAFPSPASGPGGPLTAGHKWNFDGAGYGFHTGGAGTAVFDVSRPRAPRLVTTTGAAGVQPGWNDFIHHNSARPNARAFAPYSPPSVRNGNVALITEEDYENTDCATAGSFQTWKVTTLSGKPSAVRPLDRINPVTEGGGGISPPKNAFCSAHWFDYHPSGIVALATYAGGLRLIDVRDPKNLEQYGYATFGASEVWDAYWAPKRNKQGEAIGKSNIVYTVDLVRGIDVYSVTLPGQRGAASTVPLSGPSYDAGIDGTAALVVGAGIAGVVLLRRRVGHLAHPVVPA